jgi:membrane-associated phospholipid phosphatase
VPVTAAGDGVKLSIAVATLLAALGGRRGRRAAAEGLGALVLVCWVNGLLKAAESLWSASRSSDAHAAPAETSPRTSSFPSGRAVTASAFAVAVSATPAASINGQVS